MLALRAFTLKHLAAIFITGFVFIICFAIGSDNLAIIGGWIFLLMLGLLLVDATTYFCITVLLIPVSVALDVGKGPTVSFPSELLEAALFAFALAKLVLEGR